MNSFFFSFVRILYTAILTLFGLGLVAYYPLMMSAAASGHGSFNVFSVQGILPALLFLMLLISRALFYRSPKWLLLGLPTTLVIFGLMLFLVYIQLFPKPAFECVDLIGVSANQFRHVTSIPVKREIPKSNRDFSFNERINVGRISFSVPFDARPEITSLSTLSRIKLGDKSLVVSAQSSNVDDLRSLASTTKCVGLTIA